MLDALAAEHRRAPELLGPEGRVKITDFGIAYAAGQAPVTEPGLVIVQRTDQGWRVYLPDDPEWFNALASAPDDLVPAEKQTAFAEMAEIAKDLAKKAVHEPVRKGECAKCHDPHASDNKFNLRTAGNDLCFGCHQEKKDEFAKAYVHGPVAAGVCAVCHNPHGSNEKYQLRLPQAQMCGICHQSIKAQDAVLQTLVSMR